MNKRVAFIMGGVLLIFVFSYGQPKGLNLIQSKSSITYLLSHPLHHVESVSKEMTGRVEVDVAKREIKSVSTQIDVTTFNSGNSNRDSHAMEVIDAILYPDVQFSSTSITQYSDSLKARGKLIFHGITTEITIIGKTTWSERILEVDGAFDISLTAFNIERPSLLMLKVDDTLKFSYHAVYEIQ
jgi:polyisoprenoid-binding protein YceI